MKMITHMLVKYDIMTYKHTTETPELKTAKVINLQAFKNNTKRIFENSIWVIIRRSDYLELILK